MRLIAALLLFFGFTPSLFAANLKLNSPVMKKGEAMPAKYTCDAENISPPLQWTAGSKKVQSFALILEDPDAPSGNWVHWILYDLPPMVNNLPEGLPPLKQLANGEIHGQNDFKNLGYGGPCPPQGTHRYFFRLYALDTALRLDPGISAKEFKAAIQGHVIDTAELMVRYQRANKG